MRSFSLPLDEAGHIAAVGTVERHADGAGDLRISAFKGRRLVGDLNQQFLPVPVEIDTIADRNQQNGSLDRLGLRAEFGDREGLGEVVECVFARAGHCLERQEERQCCGEDRSSRRLGECIDHAAHRELSSFDFDAQDDRISRRSQDRPRRPLATSGCDLHVGPITDATTHHLPPFADEALSARIQRLTGPEARASERSDLMTIAIAVTACLFIALIGGSAFVAAALRLPAIEQRLAEQARV